MIDCLDIVSMLGEQGTSGLQVLGRDAYKNYRGGAESMAALFVNKMRT